MYTHIGSIALCEAQTNYDYRGNSVRSGDEV